jgi:histidinol-phosphate/aromatic aminotransferase/cobyric acid decarboxylase-like protein
MLARQCERTRTNLVLDECFRELTEKPKDSSMASELLDFSSLLILRAFTKSFSVPGIRLGYLLCGDKAVAEGIAAQLPEWNVSVVAEKVGIAALSEEAWLMKAREVIMREREFLTTGLGNLGAKVFPSDANFLLFSWKDDALYEKLLEKGILIRDCRDFEGLSTGYYRVAVRTHEENEALLRVMREL